MTVAFVHGNPETAAIWDELLAQLGRDDSVALSPPGFGAPLPAGFGCTADDYLAWLVEEVSRLPGPVDLVGHDWGGGHVVRLAIARPDLIRSWTTDIGGAFDPDYVWHELAQAWQAPEVGEQTVAAMFGAPLEARVQRYVELGMSDAAARSCAAAMTEDMGKAILALYRSAVQPAMAEIGAQLPKAAANPGLVIIATEDHYTGGETLARRSAERAGAQVAVLQGLGHWWMCQDPKAGAAALTQFFETLD